MTLALLTHAFLTVTRAAAAVGRHSGTGPKISMDLIPLTVPEVRRLLAWTVSPATTDTLTWSTWRRRLQARAKRCDYARHLANLRLKY